MRVVSLSLIALVGIGCATGVAEDGRDAGSVLGQDGRVTTDTGGIEPLRDALPMDGGMLPSDAGGLDPDGNVPPPCSDDVEACVSSFPFYATGNTTEGVRLWDSYSCASSTNESGPELIYRVDVPSDGFLSAAVFEETGGAVATDVDVHLLSSLDAAQCVERGNHQVGADVEAGTWWVVVDSWVDGSARERAGAFRIAIGFLEPSRGACGLATGEMARVGDGGDHLAMPATGPMVLEAHLVTQEEPSPYPVTSRDELGAHYALSEERTGLVMYRTQAWAPLEGGSHYGAGISSPTLFPVVDEGWYVNMYWTGTSRPARSTRMILRTPGTDRAVVVSAGFETGPGNLDNIGGTPEETHFYLGTGHLDDMTLGIATDQSLPLGPRVCD